MWRRGARYFTVQLGVVVNLVLGGLDKTAREKGRHLNHSDLNKDVTAENDLSDEMTSEKTDTVPSWIWGDMRREGVSRVNGRMTIMSLETERRGNGVSDINMNYQESIYEELLSKSLLVYVDTVLQVIQMGIKFENGA